MSSSLNKQIEDYMSDYDLSAEQYETVSKLLLSEMERGLHPETHPTADIKMFPSYVRSIPTGDESGSFLALDLGGTNFRVLVINIDGKSVDMQNKIYPISQAMMLGPGSELFDYIAECIADFMKEHKLVGQHLRLGFTFSFPMKQEGLAVGRLTTWTKGFKCDGVVGENVVELLHQAIRKRQDVDVRCVAILNDTVGCLMSSAFSHNDAAIGVILGTGANACYVENIDNVHTWDGDQNEPRQVIINTEWGSFGNGGYLDSFRTQVDKEIDANSINPGSQIYEKLISGMYMGEIVRKCLVDLAQKNLLFSSKNLSGIKEDHAFLTKYVSEIEADGEDFSQTRLVLQELGVDDVSLEDCRHVQYVCSLISRRAAYLSSAGIATLIHRIGRNAITVAVDGSLYRYHPFFHKLMTNKIQAMINPGIKFKLVLSEDGSGKGAALVAAVSDSA